jgi:SAM-dependent methyltransferase
MPHYEVTDSIERFSDRAAEYTRYRPAYPKALIPVLEDVCYLTKHAVVADVGAGTGILTRLFAENGNRVIAVEPNDDMRRTSEDVLRSFPTVSIIKGQAEATTLPDASVDLIVVGQAFHWFSPAPTYREFARIATAQGALAVVWNHRPVGVTEFMDEFESVLRAHGGEYARNAQELIDDKILAGFFRATMTLRTFHNPQQLGLLALQGLLRSISYAPPPGHPAYEPMMDQLQRVFAAHQKNDVVTIDHETRLYCGRLARD